MYMAVCTWRAWLQEDRTCTDRTSRVHEVVFVGGRCVWGVSSEGGTGQGMWEGRVGWVGLGGRGRAGFEAGRLGTTAGC